MKDIVKWAMIPLAALIVMVGWKYDPNPATSAGTVNDPAVVEMGRHYRTAFDAAGLSALDAGANSTATTTPELVRAQVDALDAAVKHSAADLRAELARRYPNIETAPVESVRAFNRDLAAGWRKGAK